MKSSTSRAMPRALPWLAFGDPHSYLVVLGRFVHVYDLLMNREAYSKTNPAFLETRMGNAAGRTHRCNARF